MRFFQSRLILFGMGLALGVLVTLGIRLATYQPAIVHYHANFSLYINGQRELFKGPQYYEEDTAMCTTGAASDVPLSRAHMHDNVNTVVHVEDQAVTWGNFFANLGWILGPNFIASPSGLVYSESDTAKLHVLLNNQDYTDLGGIENRVIKDKDKLLLSYGNPDQVALQQEYAAIPNTATHYDTTPDPKTCSGGVAPTLQDRLTHMF